MFPTTLAQLAERLGGVNTSTTQGQEVQASNLRSWLSYRELPEDVRKECKRVLRTLMWWLTDEQDAFPDSWIRS